MLRSDETQMAQVSGRILREITRTLRDATYHIEFTGTWELENDLQRVAYLRRLLTAAENAYYVRIPYGY